MYSSFRAVLAVLLLVVPSTRTLAQLEENALPSPTLVRGAVQFEHLTLSDGLSQSSVYDILQDERGFIWLATQDGLNRYDGRDFKVYKRIPFDSTSFSTNWIWTLDEAPDGTIWAGTRYGGLNAFDPTSGKVKHFAHDPEDSTSLSDDFVFAVLADREGIVWAGTQQGLDRLDPETGAITHFETDPDDSTSLSQPFVASIFEDAAGVLWVGTGNGLNRLDRETGTFTRYFHDPNMPRGRDRLPDNIVSDIAPEPGSPDVLWLAGGSGLVRFDKATGEYETFMPPGEVKDLIKIAFDPNRTDVIWATSDGGGLMRFDIRTQTFTVFLHDANDPTSISHDALFGILADRSGMMWVGAQSQTGLDKFDPSEGGFVNYKHRAGDPSSLHPTLVWDLYVPPSRPEEIWSVHQDGPQRLQDRLNRIDQRTGEVDHYVYDPADPRSLGHGVILSVLEDHTGALWIATLGGGLNRFDRARNSFTRFTERPGDPASISSNGVTALHEDTYGMLWIGTNGGGLNRMDPERAGVFERFLEDSTDSSTLLGAYISPNAITSSADGFLWVGTNKGLNRIDPSTGDVQRFPVREDDPAALSGPVIDLFVDMTGTLWVHCARNMSVLHRYDAERNRFIAYVHDPADPNSPSDSRIVVLDERPQEPGVLWIGSPAGGLSRLDPKTGEFRHYTEADGLPNNFVYGILHDDEGNLWLSTNNGLSRFDPETETFRNFDEEDGLQSREFNQGSFFRAGTGQMVFGGIAGVTAFYPSELKANPVPPDVLLTDFRLFNKSVQPGDNSVLQVPIGQADKIRLAHWQKTLTFEYVGLHFKNAADNQYSYMLEGFDEDWIQAGERRSATYTNLDPGTYTFRVKAANSDGIWNERAATLALVIAPPFWETTWFRILAVLAVVGIGFTFYRMRVSQIKERNRQLESEVAARTTEIRSKNDQLEKSHAIVRAINAETGFESLLNAVLEQTRVIPGVEKASALVFDDEADAFVFKATMGWDLAELASIRMSEAEAHARYVEKANEVAEDVYLERSVAQRPGGTLLEQFDTPASLLVMRVRTGDRVEGYLVFDNMHDRDAFNQQDLDLLTTLREHIRSAFVKTRLLEDLRRSFEHLTATQAQLVQAEKMASLGQLTAGIAHEIKNPLNFINNFASLCDELAEELLEEIEKSKGRTVESVACEIEEILHDLRANASKIREHGRRADGIVRSMLQHSHGKSGRMQPTDVNALLDEYVSLAYHGMRAQRSDFNVAIDRELDPAVGTLNVVPQELGRVFINLLNNAFYAVHEKTRAVDGDFVPRVTIESRRVNGTVEMRIADNGPGIPKDVREKIFEPFFTTKPTGDGTGLGLSLSYEIVTRVHGGNIEVKSEEGVGTAFTIRLPATAS